MSAVASSVHQAVATGNYGPGITFNEGVDMIISSFLSKKKNPIMFWGGAGIGKSAMPLAAQKFLSKHLNKEVQVVDLRLLLLEPSDVRGMPFVTSLDQCKWAIAPFLPQDPDSYGILLLDELTSANQSMQKAALQLVLDGKVGEYTLPKNWLVIAAGNRIKDRGGVITMLKPLANRFQHAELLPDLENWISWAYANDIDESVIGFNRFKDALYRFDTVNEAWASPRTWEKASHKLTAPVVSAFNISSEAKDTITKKSVLGLIGSGTGTEFFAFRSIYKDLPTPEEVLNGRQINFTETDKVFAISTSIVSYINQQRRKSTFVINDVIINNVLGFIEQLNSKRDLQVAVMRDIAINAKLNVEILSAKRGPDVKARWKKIYGEISVYM